MREEMRENRFRIWGDATNRELIEKIISWEDEVAALRGQSIDEYVRRLIDEAILEKK